MRLMEFDLGYLHLLVLILKVKYALRILAGSQGQARGRTELCKKRCLAEPAAAMTWNTNRMFL